MNEEEDQKSEQGTKEQLSGESSETAPEWLARPDSTQKGSLTLALVPSVLGCLRSALFLFRGWCFHSHRSSASLQPKLVSTSRRGTSVTVTPHLFGQAGCWVFTPDPSFHTIYPTIWNLLGAPVMTMTTWGIGMHFSVRPARPFHCEHTVVTAFGLGWPEACLVCERGQRRAGSMLNLSSCLISAHSGALGNDVSGHGHTADLSHCNGILAGLKEKQI